MERLTKRLEDGQAVMDCAACGVSWHKKRKKDIPYCTALFCRSRLKERLAAYEDTGIDPDELRIIGDIKRFKNEIIFGSKADRLKELSDADKDGRLVVLPSKTVWELTMDAGPDCDLKCPVDDYDEALGCDLCSKAKQFAYERPCTQERLKELGKTVFLTREEAALKGGEG